MMSLTFGLFTQVSGSGPLGPLVSCRIFMYTLISGVHRFNGHLSSESCPFYNLIVSVADKFF